MTNYIEDNRELINNNQGNYMRFGGNGIMDGLKCDKIKNDFYLINGFDADGVLHIKGYRKKLRSYLPVYSQSQEFEIITKQEFKKLNSIWKDKTMKEILSNLALIHLNDFCKSADIDISGTHIIKRKRGFKYDLVKDNTKITIATVLFTKNTVPNFIINQERTNQWRNQLQ